jgi:hypothetical protein
MRRLLAMAVTTALAILVFPAVAQANHSWGNYHWGRTANPFTLKLGDNVTSAWDSYLQTTSSDWSRSTVLDTTIVAGQAGNSRRCPATSGRVEVCNDTYGNNGWLGLAQIWISGSHIVQGIVKVNDTYYNTATYNTPAWRNLVMCQEVGHTLGLDHQDENFSNPNLGTCMDYTNNPDSNQHPNSHDYAQLESIYSHLDSVNTVTGVAGTTGDVASWGERLSGSRAGGYSEYMNDLGNGRKVLTHVYWVR